MVYHTSDAAAMPPLGPRRLWIRKIVALEQRLNRLGSSGGTSNPRVNDRRANRGELGRIRHTQEI
jgi:hypothetical protein